MPQISDLLWLQLFLYFNLTLIAMMSLIYFTFSPKISKNLNNNNNNNMNNKKKFLMKW
uniref:ATP synthase F0 subunit 8 n=1 Tax=Gasteruption sp. M19 TaxID=162239 RepID=A0A096XMX2_9HYME|nr:ATP synthase F0 subunit 8 [Gasteruption sp. M19]